LEKFISDNKNFVFSFMAWGGKERLHVRDLIMARSAKVAAFGIEGLTTNFSVERFMPDATIMHFGDVELAHTGRADITDQSRMAPGNS
jgi:hypothetical protein